MKNKKKLIIRIIVLILILIAVAIGIFLKIKDEERGDIDLYAKDQGEKAIAGAEMKLINENGKEIASVVSTLEGKVQFINVHAGKYKIIAKSAPKGYEIDEKEKEIEVKKEEKTEVTLKYKRVRGIIIVKSTDQDGNPIEGVKYIVVNDEGETIQELTTDADGYAGVRDLPLGKYQYKQINVPDGYEMNIDVFDANLEKDEQVILTEVVNNKE